MAITLQHIADELNVSAVTVSRSLRHDRSISPETRARVNETAHRLGYQTRDRRPRRVAEKEVDNRSVGLLIRHNSLSEAHHDTNLMKMMAGLMDVMDEHEMNLKVHPWKSQASNTALLSALVESERCQAVIVHGEQDEKDLDFLSHRMPVVSLSRIYEEFPIDAAVAHNVGGVHQLVTHLVNLGHRRLAWVGAGYSTSFLEERKTGFMRGCLTHDLEIGRPSFLEREICETPFDGEGGLHSVLRSGVTGFVCGNDAIATDILNTLEKAGVRAPQDVSVVGFDAIIRTNPAQRRELTSYDPHFFEMGQAAARLALQRIAHPTIQPCILHVRGSLVEGDSAGPVPETPTHQ